VAPRRVRFAEYDFVLKQANGKALCPFCNVWHRASDGLAMAGDCAGIYVRSRKAAFVVVGLKKGRAGIVGQEYVSAGGRNLTRACDAAIKEWSEL
jgi:hypothetical protein